MGEKVNVCVQLHRYLGSTLRLVGEREAGGFVAILLWLSLGDDGVDSRGISGHLDIDSAPRRSPQPHRGPARQRLDPKVHETPLSYASHADDGQRCKSSSSSQTQSLRFALCLSSSFTTSAARTLMPLAAHTRTLGIAAASLARQLPRPSPTQPRLPWSRAMASAAAEKRLAAAKERLAGKTVLVTGASSGIGRSTALEFARTCPRDLRLVLAARRLDSLRHLAAEIVDQVGDGVQVLPVQLDVSKPDEVRDFVGNLPEEWRDIHVLVNNA